MRFDLVDAATSAGDRSKPNEDRIGAVDGMAWVVDGATDLGEPGLMGRETGGAWFARNLDEALGRVDFGKEGFEGAVRHAHQALCLAYSRERRRDERGAWEVPSGALAVARIHSTMLELAWSADCVGLLWNADAVHRLGGRIDPDEHLLAARRGKRSRTALTGSPPDSILEELRRGRALPDRVALDARERSFRHVRYLTRPVEAGDRLLLMSDGFGALLDVFGLGASDLVGLIEAAGVADAIARLRDLERLDPAGTVYPRLKHGDDASAVLLRIAA